MLIIVASFPIFNDTDTAISYDKKHRIVCKASAIHTNRITLTPLLAGNKYAETDVFPNGVNYYLQYPNLYLVAAPFAIPAIRLSAVRMPGTEMSLMFFHSKQHFVHTCCYAMRLWL